MRRRAQAPILHVIDHVAEPRARRTHRCTRVRIAVADQTPMGLEQFIRIAVVISVMLIGIALGLRYEMSEAGYLLRKPRLLAKSLITMNVFMPFIVIWLVTTLNLRVPIKVALVAMAVSPLPPLLPGAELNLTSRAFLYGIVTVAAVCSVVLVPLTVGMFTAYLHIGAVNIAKVILVVLVTVLLPLAIGIVIQRISRVHAKRLAANLYRLGAGLLIFASVCELVIEWPMMWSLLGDGTVIAIVGFGGIGLLLGHLFGGPDPQDRTVLALATASRHPGVAMVIGAASFSTPRLVTAAVTLAVLVSTISTMPYAAWRSRLHAARSAGRLAEPP
jgi:predicted Na+-dependent transporter